MVETASSIMTREVISVRPGDTVPAIATLLTKHGISAVPVVDEAGKLVGMVSEGDLMAPFSAQNQTKRAW